MNNAGEPALADGRVLRLGFIAHAELKSAFEKFITLDAIVAKKSEALIVRKAEVEGQLQRLSRDVASAEQILSRFSAFESAQAAVIAADKEAALLANKAQSSSASLRICADQWATLEQELGQRFEAGAIRRMFLRNEAATQAWWGLVVVQFERRSANKKLQWSNSERSIATCQSAQASPT